MVTEPLRSVSDDLDHRAWSPALNEAEREIFVAVAEYDDCLHLEDLDTEQVCRITAERGIDFATALLLNRIRRSREHGPAIEDIDGLCGASTPDASATRSPVRVAIVPGFLYREYPASGADGRMLREAADRLGWECDTIPLASTGRSSQNADAILAWLREHDDGQPIVLASVSKGGSDIAAALQKPAAREAFRNVIGWVSICGIVRGSPVVDRVLKQWLPRLGFRLLFAVRRWCFASVVDLRHKEGPLSQSFTPPAGMRIVHAVGFPLTDHFVHPRLRSFHKLLSTEGPNDGAILLMDLVKSPGVLYPVWGADHYMRPRYRTQPLCQGLLRYVAGAVVKEDSDD